MSNFFEFQKACSANLLQKVHSSKDKVPAFLPSGKAS